MLLTVVQFWLPFESNMPLAVMHLLVEHCYCSCDSQMTHKAALLVIVCLRPHCCSGDHLQLLFAADILYFVPATPVVVVATRWLFMACLYCTGHPVVCAGSHSVSGTSSCVAGLFHHHHAAQ